MAQSPNRPTPLARKRTDVTMMRYALRLLVLSLVSFAVAFALRRAFFSDIKPVSWYDTPPQNGALEAAFLLLSIENIAAVVAAIALIFVVVTWIRAHWPARATGDIPASRRPGD